MKAMKAKKVRASTIARRGVAGKAGKTTGGLKKGDLVKSKSGKIVSKKRSARGKKSPWIAATQAARKALGIKGFAVIKKGSALYKKAKELYKK